MEAPEIEDSMERWHAPPLLPTYIGEKGRTLGKTYMGLKRGALGTPLGNILGTHWELEGNILGAKENEKNPPPPIQNLKEKKSRHFECMLSLPIDCMTCLFPKLFITIFGLH